MSVINNLLNILVYILLWCKGPSNVLRIDSTGAGWFQVCGYKSGTKRSRILCDMSNERYYFSPFIDAYQLGIPFEENISVKLKVIFSL